MKKSDFDLIFNEKLESLKALRDAKHKEYADEGDTFRNLKDGALKLGIDPMLYAFHLMTKQYNSLHDYVKEWDATGKCEQADLGLAWEKIRDINVYNLLIYGLWTERLMAAEQEESNDEALRSQTVDGHDAMRDAIVESIDGLVAWEAPTKQKHADNRSRLVATMVIGGERLGVYQRESSGAYSIIKRVVWPGGGSGWEDLSEHENLTDLIEAVLGLQCDAAFKVMARVEENRAARKKEAKTP